VPATQFETAGAAITSGDVEKLMQRDDILYLSEMMNFPGVLNGDEEVLKKIGAARNRNKPVDGHAPGLRGDEAKKYIDAGISTDHECFTKEEALDKLQHGMKILIREGSAARNFEALADLMHDHAHMMMFCSDDKHPDSLAEGHMNQLCARAVAKGINVFNVLRVACINPVEHYHLKNGLLKPGDNADFIVVKDLSGFEVLRTYINGNCVAENGRSLINAPALSSAQHINRFHCSEKQPQDFRSSKNGGKIPVIVALNGELITDKSEHVFGSAEDNIQSDTRNDMLKIVVVNRYTDAPPAISFIKNFGLKKGAMASSVAHDSHNIVCVGVDDESICRAVNLVIRHKGGISCVGNEDMILPLPVAGLMSTADGYETAEKYKQIDAAAKALSSTLSAPFMTLSFMCLLVIPHLKLSDQGLFDGDRFQFL
jgi:adenine deaminase